MKGDAGPLVTTRAHLGEGAGGQVGGEGHDTDGKQIHLPDYNRLEPGFARLHPATAARGRRMPAPMNAFIAVLADLCAARPLDEKRLVAPSRRVGNQWLDALARAGRPVLNARVETLRSLAVGLAAPALAGAGLAVAPRRAEHLLVDRALRPLLREGRLPYLSRAKPGAGLAATVLASLAELRLEGVPEERLREGCSRRPPRPPI